MIYIAILKQHNTRIYNVQQYLDRSEIYRKTKKETCWYMWIMDKPNTMDQVM